MARPKEFDRDEALARAMDVFWRLGYEATSIGDLTEHLGIGRQSLYDTFGDKRALYLAALDRYRERYGGSMPRALDAPGPVRRVIRDAFAGVIEFLTREPRMSCMLVNAAAERCPHDPDVRHRFCSNTDALERAFVNRLRRAQADGEIAAHHDVTALARHFVNTTTGLQLTAKAGASRQALDQVADVAVSVLG